MENTKKVSELEELREKLDNDINKLMDLGKELNFIIEKFYVRNLFLDLDISDVNYKYRDLFIVSLIMDSTFYYDKDINYILEYQLKNITKTNNVYYPKYKEENGFYTPIYWASNMLDAVEGDMIYKEPGCFATSNDSDLYVVIYGDVVIDHSFAQKNGIQDFEKKYREIELDIDGLDGTYKVITQRLSFEHGTVGYYLKYFENYRYLSSNEKDYIKRIAIPSMDISIKKIKGEHKETIKYQPFNLILKKYIKI